MGREAQFFILHKISTHFQDFDAKRDDFSFILGCVDHRPDSCLKVFKSFQSRGVATAAHPGDQCPGIDL